MPVDSALIHAARVITSQRSGARNAQGEYPNTPVQGPWFDARVMLQGRGSTPRQPVASQVDAGRVPVAYEVLAGPEDQNGNPLTIPPSGWIETDCPVLGSPRLVITGQPEQMNDGDELIGWLVTGDVVEDIP